MFLIKIKADANDIDVPAVRSLLLFAILIVVISRHENIVAINIAVAIILAIAVLFSATLLVKYRINSLLLMVIAAILVMIATRAPLFPACLIVFAIVVKYSYVAPSVTFTEKGVDIKKTFHNKKHDWDNFNNVILKDNMLTLDFKNNKLLQLELDGSVQLNEKSFNDFCAKKITE